MSSLVSLELQAVRQAAHAVDLVSDPGLREYLSFRIGSESYGIDILRVQEIRSYESPTRLAGAPPALIGVMDLRGAIVPILDLRVHLGRAADVDGSTVIIVLNVGSKILGAVVDAVSFVVALSSRQIKSLPEMGHGTVSGHIDGVATLDPSQGDQLLILLDIERMMSSSELGLKL